ncbi:MAG: hypothetical protein KKE17_12335 [Proteobacteria bacterium]|nr:hypothetical protein [Pseudomonadota bacterium]MBU1710786.1 hypothetical protein [Pseudomonadota bacterium]
MTPQQDKTYHLSEERLIIKHSGEIPEVTYHGSIYYLTRDPEGPSLVLNTADLRFLQEMVLERYRVIILRDLTPENREKRLYRGLQRGAVNWERLTDFSNRYCWDLANIREEIAGALMAFLRQEAKDTNDGCLPSSINSTPRVLETFSRDLGINLDDLPSCWKKLCGNV